MHACPFHAVLDEMAAGPFDHATRYRIALGQVLAIAHAVTVLVKVPADARQHLFLGAAQLLLRGQTPETTDYRFHFALEHLCQALAHKGNHLRAALAIEQLRRLPQSWRYVQK